MLARRLEYGPLVGAVEGHGDESNPIVIQVDAFRIGREVRMDLLEGQLERELLRINRSDDRDVAASHWKGDQVESLRAGDVRSGRRVHAQIPWPPKRDE